MSTPHKFIPEYFNEIGIDKLPQHLGHVITDTSSETFTGEFKIEKHHHSPNGFLHAGSVVALADTIAGYACVAHLPEGASGFTTIEMKTNFLGTALDGTVQGVAKAIHLGKTTHVWDVTVFHKEKNKKLAIFRCTQMILYPKQ